MTGTNNFDGLVWPGSVLAWPDRLTDVNSWHSHIPFGGWCVAALRPRVLVELGTHKGDSYCALCEAVDRAGLATACYAVDTWAGDHEAGFYPERVFQELKTYHDPRYGRFSRLVRATFDEARDHFPDGSIDLLHIDGLHTYEAVRHDFETWLPKLSPAAVVLFHDINVREKDFGAWRYWQEVSSRFPHFTFQHGHGLGFLVTGPAAPEAARALAALRDDQAERVRSFFARLGEGVLTVSALRAAESRVRTLELGLGDERRLRGELTWSEQRLRGELNRSEQELRGEAERRAELERRLNAKLARHLDIEESLRTELAKNAEEVKQLQARLGSETSRLNATIHGMHEAVIDAQKALATRAGMLPSLPGAAHLRQFVAFRLPRLLAVRYQARLVAASGMFHAAWYLRRYPDVAAKGADPLRHYLLHGFREGRNPHPFFASRWYLAHSPDVAAAGINPLVHYLLCGAAEGRLPCPPPGQAGHPFVRPGGLPAGRERQTGAVRYRVSDLGAPACSTPARPGLPHVVCVTHVAPWPRRAGNEYRTGRLLDWLVAEGYPVVVVLAPLQGETVSEDGFATIAARYGNAVLCHDDGRVLTSCSSFKADLAGLDGGAVKPGERGGGEMARIERSFCHDALVGVLLELERGNAPVVWFVNYIFMTRFLPLTGRRNASFVDSHDVFSSKHDKVVRFGVNDGLSIAPEDEARLLRRADAVVAIQANEAEVLRGLVPDRPVIIAGVDFDFDTLPVAPAEVPTLLCVGSDNPVNAKGLQDFLLFAWPRISREVPEARLVVAGKVGRFVERDDPRIEVRGVVDDLSPLYREAWVVVNPTVAGTGLKIKTMEALSHFCPVVTWPHGVEGVPEALLSLCTVGEDWFDFARKTAALLQRGPKQELDGKERDRLRDAFAAQTVYAQLGEWLSQAARRGRSDKAVGHDS